MVIRYVFIKLVDSEATPEGREAVIARTRELLSDVPGVLSLTVGTPADEKSAVWDVSIALRFDDVASIEAYRVHPTHREYVQYLKPRMEVLKAWNFDVAAS